MEAHAEDCILVPPDAEAAQPREPVSTWPIVARAAALSLADWVASLRWTKLGRR